MFCIVYYTYHNPGMNTFQISSGTGIRRVRYQEGRVSGGSGIRRDGYQGSGIKGSGIRGSGIRGRILGGRVSWDRVSGGRVLGGRGIRGSGIRGSGNQSASSTIQCSPPTRIFFCFFRSSAPSSVCALERLYTRTFWQQRSLEFCILGFFLTQALRHRVEAFSLSVRFGFVVSVLLWVWSRKLVWPGGCVCVGVYPKISGCAGVLSTLKLLRLVTISKR